MATGGTGPGSGAEWLTGVTSLSTRGSTNCVVAAGKVACWGAVEPLGRSVSPEPVVVTGLANATSVSAGPIICAVLQDGTAKCLGLVREGYSGFGTDASYPMTMEGLTGVTAVSVGSDFACAIAGGEVWCWGSNTWYGLGTAGVPPSSVKPMKIQGLANVTALSVGYGNACAVSGGSVWCWGANSNQESGAPNVAPGATKLATPFQVVGLSDVVSVVAAESDYDSFAVLADGTVWRWGSYVLQNSMPATLTKVSGVSDVKSFVGGKYQCALHSNGTVSCFAGGSTYAPVEGLTDVTALSGNSNSLCVIAGGGGVECWGINGEGQLGNGTIDHSSIQTPTKVPTPVIAPCCGAGSGTFSSGLPPATQVKDLPSDQFQTLCKKARDETDGLQGYCRIVAVAAVAGVAGSKTDQELKTLCKKAYDACWPAPARLSSSTCAAVTTSTKCTLHVEEVEACVNEQVGLGNVSGPRVPDCSAVGQDVLAALPELLLALPPPACTKVNQTCPQILASP